jgi:hypothetical protein
VRAFSSRVAAARLAAALRRRALARRVAAAFLAAADWFVVVLIRSIPSFGAVGLGSNTCSVGTTLSPNTCL